jgi:hypothetical protein
VVDGLIDSAEYNNNFGEFGIPGSGGLRYCANAPTSQSPSAGPRWRGLGTSGRAITIGGDRQWVDTGINVQANDRISINANGQIRVARDGGLTSAAGVLSAELKAPRFRPQMSEVLLLASATVRRSSSAKAGPSELLSAAVCIWRE